MRSLVVAMTLAVTACATLTPAISIDTAIAKYQAVAGQIQLGDSRQKVTAILEPTQASLSARARKPSEQFMRRDQPIHIDFYRTGRNPDGLTTDDEFTPYLFIDDRLVAVGWAAIQVYDFAGSSIAESFGTCFVAAPNGTIITSYHVISNAKSIQVSLSDGRKLPALVEKESASTDLAVLRIATPVADYLSMARAGSARVGDHVFTIGYPTAEILGKDPKFTEGSISSLSGVGGEASFLQISVPVQPGNSGGPLVNFNGEVVGIIAATAAVESFYKLTGTLPQNVNWAIKAEYAQLLFEQAPVLDITADRRGAIDRTRRAICSVEASR